MNNPTTQTVTISIPLALEPLERGERFDLPLCDLFDETDAGDVVGGGTFVSEDKIESVEIELELNDLNLLPRVAQVLANGEAPLDTVLLLGPPCEGRLRLSELLEPPASSGN